MKAIITVTAECEHVTGRSFSIRMMVRKLSESESDTVGQCPGCRRWYAITHGIEPIERPAGMPDIA